MVARKPLFNGYGGIFIFINTNIVSMNAGRHLYQTNLDMDRTIERLSTGLRINSAADDASGLDMVEKMYAQRTGLATAIQNTQDGTSLFKTAEGALEQVGMILNRIEELTVRAATTTLTASDRASIVNETGELIGQIDQISNNTEYNTIKVLKQGLSDASINQILGTGQFGSVKVLVNPFTIRDATNLTLSVIATAEPAQILGTKLFSTTLFSASTVFSNSITINGVAVSIVSSDTLDTIMAKINSANSSTGVIAVTAGPANFSLISGTIDSDAANVIASTDSVINGSAVGYMTVGASAHVDIGGNATVWGMLGLPPVFSVTGSNAQVNVDGAAMVADSVSGSVLKMTNVGSNAFGLTIGTDMFNNSYGGVIFNGHPVGNQISHTSDTTGADAFNVGFSIGDTLRMHVGANYDQALNYKMNSCDIVLLGTGVSSKFGSLADISLLSAPDANISLKVVQKAIEDVTSMRSQMGAIMNRLGHTSVTLQVQNENMTAAESKIRDADISLEMTNFTKRQIMMQAGTSMLAQANSKAQGVLKLLK